MGHKVRAKKQCVLKSEIFVQQLIFYTFVFRDTRKPTAALSAVGEWKDAAI